jgi:hypothetical protein
MAERDWYDPVEAKLGEQLTAVADNFYLETGATKGFSERVKAAIPADREIVFSFLRRRPDILGYVNREYSKDLITVEVKEKSLTIEDIYQAKMYKEVFGARYAFLITATAIPEALKRLCKQNYQIQHSSHDDTYSFLAIAEFHRAGGFVEWFEDNPFAKEFYWK